MTVNLPIPRSIFLCVKATYFMEGIKFIETAVYAALVKWWMNEVLLMGEILNDIPVCQSNLLYGRYKIY